MGTILSSRIRDDSKIVLEICLEYEEAVQLKGFMQNIFVVAEDAATVETTIAQRGKREATKYFLIPKQFRKDMKFTSVASCQRIDTKTRTLFVYIIDKLM